MRKFCSERAVCDGVNLGIEAFNAAGGAAAEVFGGAGAIAAVAALVAGREDPRAVGVLALDLGERRIGVAVSDEGRSIAQPLTVLIPGRNRQLTRQSLELNEAVFKAKRAQPIR